MNKDKMKVKCEVWIEGGMGACRAPVTYDELYALLARMEMLETIIDQTSELLSLLKGK